MKKCILLVLLCIIMFAYIIHGSITWYECYDLITKLITGIAPFIAAFGAYYMWSKNREKEIKNLEYKNDYYKKIIDKRMEAYEQLEKFIASLKVTTPGKANKMYLMGDLFMSPL